MSHDKPFYIVTGAGRSGTSAVARVLHESGVRMGREMAAPSEANPAGFYEDLNVVALNERILTDVGMNDPWRPERWPARATVIDAGAAYRDEMMALACQGVDGWKDPRFAITLEAWLPALPVRPKVIVCLRSPQAYAESATRIYGLVKPGRAMREWARHCRRLLAVLRRHKLAATCVEYDALIEQPEDTVAALSCFVGRPLDARYVVSRLRRELAPVPEAYRVLYERVAALGAGPRATTIGVRGQGSGVKANIARVRGQGSRARARAVTPDYETAVAGLVKRLAKASATWESAVLMPIFDQRDEVRAACEAYNATLTGAQGEVASLVPPRALERTHEELVRRVNVERMIAELSFAAASTRDERARAATVRAWWRFGQRPLGV